MGGEGSGHLPWNSKTRRGRQEKFPSTKELLIVAVSGKCAGTPGGGVQWVAVAVVPGRYHRQCGSWELRDTFLAAWAYPVGTPRNPRWLDVQGLELVPCLSRKKREPVKSVEAGAHLCSQGWTYRKLRAIFLLPHLSFQIIIGFWNSCFCYTRDFYLLL